MPCRLCCGLAYRTPGTDRPQRRRQHRVAVCRAFPDVPLGVAVMAPHEFVEEVTLAGIRAARTAWETTDLPRKWRAITTRRRPASSATEHVPGCRRLSRLEYRGLPAEHPLPVLAIQGEDDEYATMLRSRSSPSGCRNDPLKLPRCGHSPARDQETAVLAACRLRREAVSGAAGTRPLPAPRSNTADAASRARH